MTNEQKTNEQKAQRLDEIATHCIQIGMKDAALLRECAGMMRERGTVQWMKVAGWAGRQVALYRGWILAVDEGEALWSWSADSAKGRYGYRGPTLEAAQAAAVAWVDGQEGEP